LTAIEMSDPAYHYIMPKYNTVSLGLMWSTQLQPWLDGTLIMVILVQQMKI